MGEPRPRPRLLDSLRAELRTRRYSRRTERAYVGWVSRLIVSSGRRHPAELGPHVLALVLSSLAIVAHVSASTQNQALSAILFLYRDVLRLELPWINDVVRAKRPLHLPVVLSRDEVRAVIAEMHGPPALMACILYGSGLRLLECCRLRVADIDLSRRELIVRRGKGGRDRRTMLPLGISAELSTHLTNRRAQHTADLAKNAGWVELPDALHRKYPNAGREWPWQWVFPATRHYRDRETGQLRRHHFHESAVQRIFRAAVLASGVPKHATCHTLRHSFA